MYKGGMHGRGVCMTGGVCSRGHVWHGGVCVVGSMHGRRDGHCSGWYASYWNAFLLKEIFKNVIQRNVSYFCNASCMMYLTF